MSPLLLFPHIPLNFATCVILQGELKKAEKLRERKRKGVLALKSWISNYETEHNGETPSKNQIKTESGKIFRYFNTASTSLKDAEEYVDTCLKTANITREDFERLALKRMRSIKKGKLRQRHQKQNEGEREYLDGERGIPQGSN